MENARKPATCGRRTKRTPKGETPHAELLRSHGLKATHQRMVLLEVLGSTRTPLSLHDIERDVRTRRINQSTLYRAVKDCVEVGIVRPVDLRHTHAHYELVSHRDHHHIICTQCGIVEDFVDKHCAERTKSITRSSKHFASITDHSFELYGVCKQCVTTL